MGLKTTLLGGHIDDYHPYVKTSRDGDQSVIIYLPVGLA